MTAAPRKEAGGARRSRFTVTLAEERGSETAVRFRTVDGSATDTGDYVARRGTLRFAPGQTSATVEVAVNDDDLAELDAGPARLS